MNLSLNDKYWDQRYLNDDLPWDVGSVTPPMKAIIDSLESKSLDILVPGAGLGHEVAYLFEKGFKNVFVCEWAPAAAMKLQSGIPSLPPSHLLVQDFFHLNGSFDLILEQTFFSAIPRNMRQSYVKKVSELLKPGGALRGVLFATEFPFEGPPFGGTLEEYKALFTGHFDILKLELCKNSIPARAGNEFEIFFVKP